MKKEIEVGDVVGIYAHISPVAKGVNYIVDSIGDDGRYMIVMEGGTSKGNINPAHIFLKKKAKKMKETVKETDDTITLPKAVWEEHLTNVKSLMACVSELKSKVADNCS
jgi:hypothetical protein